MQSLTYFLKYIIGTNVPYMYINLKCSILRYFVHKYGYVIQQKTLQNPSSPGPPCGNLVFSLSIERPY